MKKNQSKLLVLMGLSLGTTIHCTPSYAAESLEDSLKALDAPVNQAPAVVATEKLYAVQARHSQLKYASEISILGARRFLGSTFLNTNEVGAGYRFHLSNDFSLGLEGTYVFNEFTNATNYLLTKERILPDLAYVKYTGDFLLTYNLFYGKFRMSMDQVFYFDNYISVGPGMTFFEKDKTWAAVADIGFAFWFGRWTSVRIGVKDRYYHERRRLSESKVHNITGHMSLGLVL
jgi:outer membrane beta-barrel protein